MIFSRANAFRLILVVRAVASAINPARHISPFLLIISALKIGVIKLYYSKL
jgi:hypothetical protein